MDVVIKNMKKPAEDSCIRVYEGGTERVIKTHEVIDLPPHGRLGDLDTLADQYRDYLFYTCPAMSLEKALELVNVVREAAKIATTVLEASI